MFVKSFLSSSRKLVNVSLISSYRNTKPIQNKHLRCELLLEQRIHRVNCVTQFRHCSLNSSENVKAEVAEEDLYGVSFFDSQHEVVTEENQDRIFNEIAKGDPEKLKKLKVMDFELHVFREQFGKVPTKLTKAMFEELLQRSGVSNRKKYLMFLFYNELKKKKIKVNKAHKEEKRLQKQLEREKEGKLINRVGESSLFLRIYDKFVQNQYAQRQLSAQMFSQQVIFDCSYDPYMTIDQAKNCASQLFSCYVENVTHVCPFALKLFNYDKKGKVCKYLHQMNPLFSEETHPLDFHSESFLDFYDKERLVYLSPHSKHELLEWNHNDIYIIGAFVDKGNCVPASRVKYQQYNIRSARLPLDSKVKWKVGDKSLPLNTVLKILLDLRLYENWLEALRNLPRRKIVSVLGVKNK